MRLESDYCIAIQVTGLGRRAKSWGHSSHLLWERQISRSLLGPSGESSNSWRARHCSAVVGSARFHLARKSLTVRLVRGGGRVGSCGVRGNRSCMREGSTQSRGGLEPSAVWACEHFHCAIMQRSVRRGGGGNRSLADEEANQPLRLPCATRRCSF